MAEDITLQRILELKGNTSQDKFAEIIHTSQSNISKMLKGTPPSAATLKAMAEAYDVSIDWLLGLTDHRKRASLPSQVDFTYADVLAMLDKLFAQNSIEYLTERDEWGITQGEPQTDKITIKDEILKYILEKRCKAADPALAFHDTWMENTCNNFANISVVKWDDEINHKVGRHLLYEVKPPTTDDEAIKLAADVASGKFKEVPFD